MRFFRWIKSLFVKKSGQPQIVVPPPQCDKPGVCLGLIAGATTSEVTMIMEAMDLVAKVIASPYFQDEIMRAKFTSTNGMTNEQIYKRFTESEITVNVRMFTGSWVQNRVYKTVGFDSAGDDFVHANRYFVRDAKTLASLIIHECAHSLGWSHSSASEHTSIPYSMNTISERIMEKL